MPKDDRDIVNDALLNLQHELSTFGSIHGQLREAHDKLETAQREWDDLTKDQRKSAKQLVDATNSAIEATKAVTTRAVTMTNALVPLAEAIKNVNFPMRLDKIDLAVSTQASTLATFQGTSERGIRELQADSKGVEKQISHGFANLSASMASSRKREIMMTALLLIIIISVAGLAIAFCLKFVFPLAH